MLYYNDPHPNDNIVNDSDNVDSCPNNEYSSINDFYISCQYNNSEINKNEIICFYFIKDCNDIENCDNKIVSSIFDINSEFNNIS